MTQPGRPLQPSAPRDANHDSVEDVLRRSGNHVVDSSHLTALCGIHRNALVKHLVGDRKALVHSCTLPRARRDRLATGRCVQASVFIARSAMDA